MTVSFKTQKLSPLQVIRKLDNMLSVIELNHLISHDVVEFMDLKIQDMPDTETFKYSIYGHDVVFRYSKKDAMVFIKG